MNIEQIAKDNGVEVRRPEIYYTESVASPIALQAFAKAIIKAYVAEVEKCEPVFAEYLDDDTWERINVKDVGAYSNATFKTRLLYTTPQPIAWVGLSDSDMFSVQYDLQYSANGFTPLEYARAIEAKLRELNTKG